MTSLADPARDYPGLTDTEATRRAAAGLANLEPGTSEGDWQVVRRNVVSFFNLVLAALIAALLLAGEFRDGLFVGIVVVANVVLATVQELVATRRLRELRALTAPRVTVRRDHRESEIAGSEVVQGDLVVLRRGYQVVADGRIVEGAAEVDESLLTGESSSVRRQAGDELRSGAFCVAGECLYEAERVGPQAYALRLTAQARGLVRRTTPLLDRFNRLLRVLLIATGFLAMILFIQFNVQERGFAESLKATTATVTTIVPVGLLLGITVVTAVGAVRVSRAGSIVHDLNAVEALNYVDVVAFDKTGTLTSNRLILRDIRWRQGGEIEAPWLAAFAATVADESRTGAALAEGVTVRSNGAVAVQQVPFNSERRWSAALLEHAAAGQAPERRVFVLGAPETILAAAADDRGLAAEYRASASAGLRGVAIAEAAELPTPDAPLAALSPIALVTFEDELRGEVREAFDLMATLGISPKVISGDHPGTVSGLLTQLGVEVDGVVSGIELEKLAEAEFASAVEDNMVFGRVSPALKERIVTTLKENGHFVAMVGDGANDVLALRAADVAVAMASGAAITRGVAGIVLLRDSFTALIRGTREATFILGNSERLAKLFTAKSVYAYVLILATNMLGLEFPFLPRQGSVFSTLSLGIPALLVAMSAPPTNSPGGILTRVVRFALPAGAALGVSAMTLQFIVEGLLGRDVEESRTLVSLTLTVVGLAFFVEVVGLEDATMRVPWRPLLTACVAIVLLAVLVTFVRTESIREFFAFAEVSAVGWVSVGVASIAALTGQYVLTRHWRGLLHLLTAQPSASQRRGRNL